MRPNRAGSYYFEYKAVDSSANEALPLIRNITVDVSRPPVIAYRFRVAVANSAATVLDNQESLEAVFGSLTGGLAFLFNVADNTASNRRAANGSAIIELGVRALHPPHAWILGSHLENVITVNLLQDQLGPTFTVTSAAASQQSSSSSVGVVAAAVAVGLLLIVAAVVIALVVRRRRQQRQQQEVFSSKAEKSLANSTALATNHLSRTRGSVRAVMEQPMVSYTANGVSYLIPGFVDMDAMASDGSEQYATLRTKRQISAQSMQETQFYDALQRDNTGELPPQLYSTVEHDDKQSAGSFLETPGNKFFVPLEGTNELVSIYSSIAANDPEMVYPKSERAMDNEPTTSPAYNALHRPHARKRSASVEKQLLGNSGGANASGVHPRMQYAALDWEHQKTGQWSSTSSLLHESFGQPGQPQEYAVMDDSSATYQVLGSEHGSAASTYSSRLGYDSDIECHSVLANRKKFGTAEAVCYNVLDRGNRRLKPTAGYVDPCGTAPENAGQAVYCLLPPSVCTQSAYEVGMPPALMFLDEETTDEANECMAHARQGRHKSFVFQPAVSGVDSVSSNRKSRPVSAFSLGSSATKHQEEFGEYLNPLYHSDL